MIGPILIFIIIFIRLSTIWLYIEQISKVGILFIISVISFRIYGKILTG